jgi:hypothetical protein
MEDETTHSWLWRQSDTVVKDVADDTANVTSLQQQLTGIQYDETLH